MTSRYGCKIGAVKFKSGGSLRVLDKPEPPYRQTVFDAIDEWREGAMNDIPDPVGFVAIVWNRDNTHTIHDFFSADSNVPRSMGPSYVAECMRRRNSVIDNDGY